MVESLLNRSRYVIAVTTCPVVRAVAVPAVAITLGDIRHDQATRRRVQHGRGALG
jgi:hypothetical protein